MKPGVRLGSVLFCAALLPIPPLQAETHPVSVDDLMRLRSIFQPEKAQRWSPARNWNSSSDYTYDIHPDGKRLAILAAREESSGVVQDQVVFFFGFGDYLKKIAPVRP